MLSTLAEAALGFSVHPVGKPVLVKYLFGGFVFFCSDAAPKKGYLSSKCRNNYDKGNWVVSKKVKFLLTQKIFTKTFLHVENQNLFDAYE
ncbi:MAG: hypothetical protein NWF05_05620 [Candidatus Bathyarchaeota archaeon]|nr:hypothetical protein [Candidatus Bathyarchaeota archaeon]